MLEVTVIRDSLFKKSGALWILIFTSAYFFLVNGFDYPTIYHKVEPICPSGFRFIIDHYPGIQKVALYATVNRQLKPFGPSDMSKQVFKVGADGKWSLSFTNVHLKEGDVINYRAQVLWLSRIIDIETQSWIYSNPETCVHDRINPSLKDTGCTPSLTVIPGRTLVCEGELIFNEEFNYLDFGVWKHEVSTIGGKNDEFQAYVNNHNISRVENGILRISPLLTEDVLGSSALYHGELDLREIHTNSASSEGCTNPSVPQSCMSKAVGAQILRPVLSAKLTTKASFSFLFGRVLIRAKLPTGDWLLPGIYMNPRYNMHGSWSQSGEFIVAERCNEHIRSGLRFHSTEEVVENLLENSTDTFHEYEFYWTPDFVQLSVDEEPFLVLIPKSGKTVLWRSNFPNKTFSYQNEEKMISFDQPVFLSISLAAGGTSDCFPDDFTYEEAKNGTLNTKRVKPWNNTLPTAMLDFWLAKDIWFSTWGDGGSTLEIDHIKVWAL